MSKGKQYKNVYTILEKVKKGEIQSHYQSKDGLFGKLNFYKKPDLIKPHMHYLDSDRLDSIARIHNTDEAFITDYLKKLSTQSKYITKVPDSKKPNASKFRESISENFRKFPKHLTRDIYKLFYHKMDRLEFEDRTEKNQTQFRFLEKANNPVGKIMTEHSNLKSSIYAKNILLYYLTQITTLEYMDPEAHQKLMDALNGKGGEEGFDQDQLDKALENMFDNKLSKEMLEKAMDNAQSHCQGLDDTIPEDVQEKMFEDANKSHGNTVDKMSPDYIRKVASNLATIKMSLSGVKEKIKKLLDRSTAYFSAREIVTFDDLFNSDNLAGLDEYVMLHPSLRSFMAEDVLIKDVKKVGKLDIYIDISGSMSSPSGTKSQDGVGISKIDFAKSFAVKLKEMDMLNNVYLFDTRVYPCGNDVISISMIDAGGGTSIDTVVRKLHSRDNNAIVITDAEDSCSMYSHKAFFIGVNGSRFHHFANETIQLYSANKQVIEFDGSSIYNIDSRGYRIQTK